MNSRRAVLWLFVTSRPTPHRYLRVATACYVNYYANGIINIYIIIYYILYV